MDDGASYRRQGMKKYENGVVSIGHASPWLEMNWFLSDVHKRAILKSFF
jgi:hypothetical protein